MFGAKKAAEQWARTRQKKDRAAGRAEGRKGLIAELRARANGSPELNRLLDEIENGDQKTP